MNEHTIQNALALWFGYRRNLCLPNVAYGLGHWRRGEMDFVAISRAGYCTEVEIKCSLADLRREWRKPGKARKHAFAVNPGGIKRFYICVPDAAADRAWAEVDAQPSLAYAGLLRVFASHHESKAIRIDRAAWSLPTSRKLSADERLHVGRLANARYWDLRVSGGYELATTERLAQADPRSRGPDAEE